MTEILRDEVFPFLEKTYREEGILDLRTACLYAMGEVRTRKSRKFLEELTGEEIEFLEQISANDRRHRRDIRRAVRRINYREENGEDWAVARIRKMRRISGCGPVP